MQFAVDPEALLAAIREKYGNSKQEISAAELKEVFLGRFQL